MLKIGNIYECTLIGHALHGCRVKVLALTGIVGVTAEIVWISPSGEGHYYLGEVHKGWRTDIWKLCAPTTPKGLVEHLRGMSNV